MWRKSIKRSQTKQLIYTFFALFFVFFFLSAGSVSACGACSLAPAGMQRYFTAMDRLLNVLDTPPYQQGTGNQFVEDGKEISFAAKAGIQSLGMSTMMSFVLVAHTSFFDMWGEIKTLAAPQARRRDREQLMQVDRKIMMKGISIAQRAYVGRNISEQQLDQIDQILETLDFVELNKISGSYVPGLKTATYDSILRLYRDLNFLFKKLHEQRRYHTDLDQLGAELFLVDDVRRDEVIVAHEREKITNFRTNVQTKVENIMKQSQGNRRGQGSELLDFKEDYMLFAAYIWQMQQDYACAIGTKNQCDSTRKSTIAQSRENTKGRTSDIQRSMKMFADARSRLAGALWSTDEGAINAANQREEALLKSFYGGDIPPARNWFGNNPGVPQGNNPGIATNTNLGLNMIPETVQDIEQSTVAIGGLTRRLQDAFKNRGNETRNRQSPVLTDSISLTNVPRSDAQADAAKYLTESAKFGAFQTYQEDTVTARWLNDDIQLQSTYAQDKRVIQIAAVHQTFNDIFALQQERENELVFHDVRSTTRLFPLLSAAVWKNIELRGNKNEPSERTIYNSAGKVCELQCSNLQGRCWYHTN